jgi:predicted dehydrogenase
MHFALLGMDEEALAFADALVADGRHQLTSVMGCSAPPFAPAAKSQPDLEEILADPAIELVVVGSAIGERGEHLRRAVQSECDVICAVPCAKSIELVYETAVVQAETKKVLLPLLPFAIHPRIAQLRSEIRSPITLIKWDLPGSTDGKGFAGWTELRRLGGEITEVTAVEIATLPGAPNSMLITGRFENQGMFQVSVDPTHSTERLVVQTKEGAHTSDTKSESVAAMWRPFVEEYESQRSGGQPKLSWQDAVRHHELSDAMKRSLEKRRTESLDNQEVSAESASKGTLTLIGCGMIWLIVLIFGISIWVPWIRWAVVPILIGFLGLVLVRALGRRV